MNYTILIYETADDFSRRNDPAQQKEYWGGWPPYMQALREAGVYVSGAVLEPPDTATTLRFRDNDRLVQDGPFADTKEQLGGFYIIDVPDLDTALEWASRCPSMPGRAYEVRPTLRRS